MISRQDREDLLDMTRRSIKIMAGRMMTGKNREKLARYMGWTIVQLRNAVNTGEFSADEFAMFSMACGYDMVVRPATPGSKNRIFSKLHEGEENDDRKEKEKEMTDTEKYEYVLKVHVPSGKQFAVGPFKSEEEALHEMDTVLDGGTTPVRTQRGSLVKFGMMPEAVEIVRFSRKD